jgi:hypothetical protein
MAIAELIRATLSQPLPSCSATGQFQAHWGSIARIAEKPSRSAG